MKSKLERKWWFALPVCAPAACLASLVMESAGIGLTYGFSQWLLYAFCFAGLERGLSFVAWLAVLAISPSSALAERAR